MVTLFAVCIHRIYHGIYFLLNYMNLIWVVVECINIIYNFVGAIYTIPSTISNQNTLSPNGKDLNSKNHVVHR